MRNEEKARYIEGLVGEDGLGPEAPGCISAEVLELTKYADTTRLMSRILRVGPVEESLAIGVLAFGIAIGRKFAENGGTFPNEGASVRTGADRG